MSRRASALLQYGGVLVAGALALAFLLVSPDNKDISLATSAVVFGIAASGLGFLWGQVGEVNIAHGAIFGVGAYTAAIAQQEHGLGLVPALGIALLTGAVAAFVVALPSLRTRGHYFVILTFAIGQVAVVTAGRLESVTGGLDGITVLAGSQEVLGLELSDRKHLYIVSVGVAVLVLLALLVTIRSSWGATLRGIRENEDLAAALGTPVIRHRILGFVVSGAVGAVGGVLYAYNVRFIAPSLFSVESSIFFLLMVLLGGRRYLFGPVLGAIVYVFLPHFIFLSPERSQMVLGLVLVAMILVLPNGVFSLGGIARRALARARGGSSGTAGEADPEAVVTEPAPALAVDR